MDHWKIEQEYETILAHRWSNQNSNPADRSPQESGSFWQGLVVAGWLAFISWFMVLLVLIVL
jgi:hypothetical protein